MATIDRYILTQMAKPLLLSVSVVLIALLLERMLRLLDLLVNKGGPFYLVFKMMVNLVPHYLGMALPAAFFLSVLLVISRLGGDSELEAMQGCGLSLRRLVTPLFVFGVLLTCFTAMLLGYVQPFARYAYRAVYYVVTHAAWDAQIEEGAFLSSDGKLTIMAQRVEGGGARLAKVFVNQDREDGSAVTTTAREGALTRDNEGYRLRLRDGVQIQSRLGEPRANVITFAELSLLIDLDNEVAPFRARGDSEREMTLIELWKARRGNSVVPVPRISSEMHGRLARISTVLFLPLLALPLGLASRRQRRSHGIVVAFALLFAYHHALQYGEGLVDRGSIGPLIGIWLPFAAFSGFSLWMFFLIGAKPGNNPFSVLLERLERVTEWLRMAMARPRAA